MEPSDMFNAEWASVPVQPQSLRHKSLQGKGQAWLGSPSTVLTPADLWGEDSACPANAGRQQALKLPPYSKHGSCACPETCVRCFAFLGRLVSATELQASVHRLPLLKVHLVLRTKKPLFSSGAAVWNLTPCPEGRHCHDIALTLMFSASRHAVRPQHALNATEQMLLGLVPPALLQLSNSG